jgi:hypothetical protein
MNNLKLHETVAQVMCGFVYVILVYFGDHFVWFNRCVYVFVCASNVKFVASRWDLYGRVMEKAVNDLLLSMILLLIIHCDDILDYIGIL